MRWPGRRSTPGSAGLRRGRRAVRGAVLDRRRRISTAPLSAASSSPIPRRVADLEAIVHPVVRDAILGRIDELAEADAIVVLDLPLLVETGGRERYRPRRRARGRHARVDLAVERRRATAGMTERRGALTDRRPGRPRRTPSGRGLRDHEHGHLEELELMVDGAWRWVDRSGGAPGRYRSAERPRPAQCRSDGPTTDRYGSIMAADPRRSSPTSGGIFARSADGRGSSPRLIALCARALRRHRPGAAHLLHRHRRRRPALPGGILAEAAANAAGVDVSPLHLFPMPNVERPHRPPARTGRRVGGRRKCRQPARTVATPRARRAMRAAWQAGVVLAGVSGGLDLLAPTAGRPTRSARPPRGRRPRLPPLRERGPLRLEEQRRPLFQRPSPRSPAEGYADRRRGRSLLPGNRARRGGDRDPRQGRLRVRRDGIGDRGADRASSTSRVALGHLLSSDLRRRADPGTDRRAGEQHAILPVHRLRGGVLHDERQVEALPLEEQHVADVTGILERRLDRTAHAGGGGRRGSPGGRSPRRGGRGYAR